VTYWPMVLLVLAVALLTVSVILNAWPWAIAGWVGVLIAIIAEYVVDVRWRYKR
jgi:succinate-acetate transporter protein